jgi:hypothetical protein
MINPYSTVSALREQHFIPADDPAAGLTVVRGEALGGLPLRLALDQTYAAIMVVPSGSAHIWQTAPIGAVVADAMFDRTGILPDVPPAPHALPQTPERQDGNARLLVVRGRVLIGAVPLRAGTRYRLPAAGAAEIEIVVVDYRVDAAAMRGAPASGGRLALGWRNVAGYVPFAAPQIPAPVRALTRQMTLEKPKKRRADV